MVLVFSSVVVLFLLDWGNHLATAYPPFDEPKSCEREHPGSVCTLARQCPSAIESIKKWKRHDLLRCGFDGLEEIVCCPDPQRSQFRMKNDTDKGLKPRNPTQRKSDAACDEIVNEVAPQVSTQIFGGKDAEPGEFPHMAAIAYPEDIDSNQTAFKCGGTLIEKKYVLTAAHCVVLKDETKPQFVRLGKLDIKGNTDNLISQDYKVADTIVHPQFSRRGKVNDIALIRLKKSVEYTEYVHPACLYTKSDNPYELVATGWGATSFNQVGSDILQKVSLLSVSVATCNQTLYSLLRKNISPNQFCAISDDRTKDTCQGDSGGPLQIQFSIPKNVYSVVGVTSYGVNCGGVIPGVYTRVYRYLDWIESVVWP